jgi:adenosylhomocysteine nucleosidase
MKRFGIIGAMDIEVEMLKKEMVIEEQRTLAGMEFCVGILEGQQAVVVICGIGKVNAAVCTQVLISVFGCTHVINTGVAGAVHDDLQLGDLVISTDVLEHDFDATGFGYEPGQIPRMAEWIFKADNGLIDLAQRAVEQESISHQVLRGRIVSGDVFVSSAEIKHQLQSRFNAYATEMEGAAVGHCCWLSQVPFLILRAMSDKADGTAHESFEAFCEEAAVNSSRIVRHMLRHAG